MSDEIINKFVDTLFQKVSTQINNQINTANIEFCSMGIVVSISEDNANAKVDLGFTTTDFIPNLSGDSLAVGSVVKVFYDDNTLRNAYVGLRLINKEAPNGN